MALCDTQDLVTSSSSGNNTPCFHGRKLQQWQLDTEQQALEALQHVRENMAAGARASGQAVGSRPRDREDGEITSASDSDSSYGIRSWGQRPVRPPPTALNSQPRGASALPVLAASGGRGGSTIPQAGRSLHGGFLQHGGSGKEPQTVTGAATKREEQGFTALFGGPQLRSSKQLAAVLIATFLVRAMLLKVTSATAAGETLVPAMLTAVLAAGALAGARSSLDGLDVERMMETTTTPASLRHRGVTLRIGGPHWTLWKFELTLEEAFGLSCTLAQLALLFLFESWGMHGPRALRWAAVAGHAVLVVTFTVVAHEWFTRNVSQSQPGEAVGVVWLCIVMGNWATTSWAAATWWRDATAATSEEEEMALALLPVRVPVLALACVQLANFWMARHAQQPELLSACVVLAGISMAGCCHCHGVGPLAAQAPTLTTAPWSPAIYVTFCAMSAWVLWQELFRSL